MFLLQNVQLCLTQMRVCEIFIIDSITSNISQIANKAHILKVFFCISWHSLKLQTILIG